MSQIIWRNQNLYVQRIYNTQKNKAQVNLAIFVNYTTIEFEGRQFIIVRNYIDYLQIRYHRTDFREHKEKQIPGHFEHVDFNLPYKEFMKQKGISF